MARKLKFKRVLCRIAVQTKPKKQKQNHPSLLVFVGYRHVRVSLWLSLSFHLAFPIFDASKKRHPMSRQTSTLSFYTGLRKPKAVSNKTIPTLQAAWNKA